MAVVLALVEMSSIFAAVSAMILVGLRPLLTSSADVTAALTQAFVLSLSCVVACYLNNLYDLRAVPSFGQFASRLPMTFSLALLLLGGLYLLLPRAVEGRFVWGGLMSLALVLPVRAVSYTVIRRRPFLERVLILGTSPLANKLIEELEAHARHRYTIAGVVDDGTSVRQPASRYLMAGSLEQLAKIVQLVRPNRIVVALGERRGRLPVNVLLEALMRRIVVEDGVEMYERLTGKVAIEVLAPSSMLLSKDFRPSPLKVRIGRVSSLIVATVALVTLAPVLGLIAVAIRLDSRGPAFFRQERVGLRGRRFTLIKFRTMRPVDRAPSEWECDNCDRITRIGKWLRRFRLDELPQLVNIIRGEMNLVGPRPHPVSNEQLFMEKIPLYSFRAMVRPGLTGWAQIRYGYANNLEEETEKVRYDLYYIKRMSPWIDLRIVLDTVKVALLGRTRPAVATPEGEWPSPELNRAA